jgi:hypothetical protein
MTMPEFTAESSLYKTSGHYRTGRYSFSAQTALSRRRAASAKSRRLKE